MTAVLKKRAMILLWGLTGDRPLTAVREILELRGAPVFFLNQALALETELELLTGTETTGILSLRDEVVHLEQVKAIYLRPYDSRRLPSVIRSGRGSAGWDHAIDLEDMLTSWAEITPALVVNTISAMSSNNSKPYQSAIIRSIGFSVPDTLITTDRDAVLQFWHQHRDVVYKSISGVRSIVSRLSAKHIAQLDKLRWCPSQFQEYVQGDDYRVHVVGEQVFACRILCNADDYRYRKNHDVPIRIESCSLPTSIQEKCIALTRALQLNVSGIDLRRTQSGQWFCFEANPSPGYTFYEQATKQPIAEAIAQLLLTGSVPPTSS